MYCQYGARSALHRRVGGPVCRGGALGSMWWQARTETSSALGRPAYLPAPNRRGYEVPGGRPARDEVTRLGPVYAPSHQCPVPIGRLVVLRADVLGPEPTPRRGTILVARAKAETLGRAFGELYSAGFRIERMDIWAAWWARLDPAAGELVNNTVGFSCRKLQSGSWCVTHSGRRSTSTP